MNKKTIHLEEAADLTKKLFHDYYAGDTETWFSCLCPDSTYLGTGEPMLFGHHAIENHFQEFKDKNAAILQEEYYPIALGDQAAQVCGQLTIENREKRFHVIHHFTFTYRLINGEVKLIHQHNSYEYMRSGESDTMEFDLNTTQFVRNLLLSQKSTKRIPIRSGRQVIFVDPHSVLYVQAQNKRTELVCLDKVISCNSSISELAKELPKIFYPLHRGYLVNTLFIVAIRRFEAELISGICIPIPALTYMQAKEDLLHIIGGR